MFQFTAISHNSKIGAIPATVSGKDTCPDACPLKANGCYADLGPIGWNWNKVSDGRLGGDYETLLAKIKKLPRNQLWRHNNSGDLVGQNELIDIKALESLIKANKGKLGYTYTHYDVLSHESNARAVKMANDGGLTINLSANDINHADKLKALNIAPVVTVLPMDSAKVTYTEAGHKVVVCPAQTKENMNCARCGLCQVQNRSYIIGFLAHGARKKVASKIALG
jgi:hypothetical protein